jgi:hypothetical protein
VEFDQPFSSTVTLEQADVLKVRPILPTTSLGRALRTTPNRKQVLVPHRPGDRHHEHEQAVRSRRGR